MKALSLTLIFMTYMAAANAAPNKKIAESCLSGKSGSTTITYVDFRPSNFYVEEDADRTIEAKTILYRNRSFGMWENSDSSLFGLIADDREVPVAEVIKLGPAAPSSFTPYTAQWGEVRDATNTYLCITFNFEGLGQSGSFQNIRGVYLFDLLHRPAKIYYLVGDVRSIKK